MSQRRSDEPDPHNVPVTFVAAVLNRNVRQVQRLTADGVLPPLTSRGSYDLTKVVPAWIAYLSREKTGSDTLAAAKLDFWRARATRERLEADELGESLLPKEDVRLTLAEMAADLGGLIDGFPARTVDEVRAAKDEGSAREVLIRECRTLRDRMADAIVKLAGPVDEDDE